MPPSDQVVLVCQDLALYKKFREKEVASAARSLIALFRELAPGMLEKRDRGRDADLATGPRAFGERAPASRVEGAELLQAALERGDKGSTDPEDSDLDDDSELGSGEETGGSEDDGEEMCDSHTADAQNPVTSCLILLWEDTLGGAAQRLLKGVLAEGCVDADCGAVHAGLRRIYDRICKITSEGHVSAELSILHSIVGRKLGILDQSLQKGNGSSFQRATTAMPRQLRPSQHQSKMKL